MPVLFTDTGALKTLYRELWARSFMSRDRFKALMATLHVVDPAEAGGD